MKNMKWPALALVALLSGCATSNPNITVANGGSLVHVNGALTVAQGQTTRVSFVAMVNPDCSSKGYPEVRIRRQPQHGRLTYRRDNDFPSFSRILPAAQCNDRRVPGVRIEYHPNADYVGPDSFVFSLFNGMGREVEGAVSVLVR